MVVAETRGQAVAAGRRERVRAEPLLGFPPMAAFCYNPG